MSEEARSATGRRAFQELHQTEEAFAKVRAAILEQIASTSPGQPEKILTLHMAVQNLEAVKAALISVIQDGQIADAAIAVAGLTRQN